MKKIYLNPEVYVMNLRVGNSLLAGSLPKSNDKINPGQAQSPRLSGRHGYVDDEEEDDEEDW
jgi:hypothetical protein